jgi:hypothetical protein
VALGRYSTIPPTSFNRSWSAVLGAFDDQGVRIVNADRSIGEVQGARNGVKVTGSVRTQADGRLRVEFNTSGNTSSDPDLINRLSRAYEQRMGR